MAVSLQISLAPGDFLHVRHLLAHQLDILSRQVDEILLIVDTKPGEGRFAENWIEYREMLNDFLFNEIATNYDVKIKMVDYSRLTSEKIATCFFGTRKIPLKDFRGGPFYAYFFGLYLAENNFVFHLDSDMLLGGGSQVWVNEACQIFAGDPACLIVSPLPGPPHPLDIIKDQQIVSKVSPYTWQLVGMSTRIFMIDKRKLIDHKLKLSKPSIRNQFKAIIEGNDNADLPEHLISALMVKLRFKRIDFLGSGRGLWSLHPPYRTAAFYDYLPQLIKQIVFNELPEQQLGFYDVIDEVVDWSTAKEKIKYNRWWKKLYAKYIE